MEERIYGIIESLYGPFINNFIIVNCQTIEEVKDMIYSVLKEQGLHVLLEAYVYITITELDQSKNVIIRKSPIDVIENGDVTI